MEDAHAIPCESRMTHFYLAGRVGSSSGPAQEHLFSNLKLDGSLASPGRISSLEDVRAILYNTIQDESIIKVWTSFETYSSKLLTECMPLYLLSTYSRHILHLADVFCHLDITEWLTVDD